MMPQICAAVSLSNEENDGGLSIKNNSKNDNRCSVEYEYCRDGMSVCLHSDWAISECHNWMEKEMMRFLEHIMQTTRALWSLIQLWAKAGH